MQNVQTMTVWTNTEAWNELESYAQKPSLFFKEGLKLVLNKTLLMPRGELDHVQGE